MPASLAIDDLRLGYEGPHGLQVVVDGFSLSLGSGRIGCLLGPSGCGKTTVLRAIAGFEPARSGSIRLGGTLLSTSQMQMPPEKRRVGMMFQEYALFPHLNARDNIGFGLRRLERAAREARIAELLALVGLQDLGGRFAHELSGGQQQRIALARALAPAPALLLLDEPFSNLDATTRQRLAAEVAAILRAAQQTALMVTHHEADAHAIADHVGVMRDGKLADWREA